MNEVIKNIKTRHSVRKFKSDPVEKSLIAEITDAGLYAASGMNRQSPIIIAVTNRELRDRLMKINAAVMGRDGTDPFYGAPVILVVLAKKDAPTHVYDGSLVLGNMMLAAHSLGLSTCWIHRAKEEFESAEGKEILKELGIEGDYEGIGHLALGYADGEPSSHPINKNRFFFAE